MNANILSSEIGLLIGALLLLIAGILIGSVTSGQRQVVPTYVLTTPRDDSSNVGGMMALIVVLVIVIAALARTL
jgi:uncharacterized protein HemY